MIRLSELYTSNAFGDVESLRDLSVDELVEECAKLLRHWVDVLGWDMGDTTADKMANYLEREWGR
jgi:hypothetical protein